MSLLSALFLVLLIFCKICSCAHILISAITASYGHWNSLLHIAKEALSRDDHFITFVIDENYDDYLSSITNNMNYDENKYQIIYTPHEERLDFDKLSESSIRVHDGMIKHASVSFISKAIYLNHSQSMLPITDERKGRVKSLLNYNNNISLSKVDLCLLDAFNLFDITLCASMFDIPTIINMVPALISKAEYYSLRNTFIYYCDPFSLDFYSPMINSSIMSYKQKWMNVITNAVYLMNQKLTAYYIIIPILSEFNAILSAFSINKSFQLNGYKNGFTDFWDEAVIISSLSTPFTPMLYTRPRIKQFGFLLYSKENIDFNIKQWIDISDNVLFISMGSVHRLSSEQMQTMYRSLMWHSKHNKYRVLWALKHSIYSNITNDELQNDEFKIMSSVQQLQVLKHPNIKLFITHCGEGGIVEGIFSKTLMVLYPIVADQYMNGKRAEEVGVGLLMRDIHNLTHIIDILLFNTHYQNQLNKVSKMIQYNGGIKEAMDFIEYAIQFDTQHLLCTFGDKYKCKDIIIPWYQQTMIDVYAIIVTTLLFITIFIKRCICDLLFNCKNISKRKTD